MSKETHLKKGIKTKKYHKKSKRQKAGLKKNKSNSNLAASEVQMLLLRRFQLDSMSYPQTSLRCLGINRPLQGSP